MRKREREKQRRIAWVEGRNLYAPKPLVALPQQIRVQKQQQRECAFFFFRAQPFRFFALFFALRLRARKGEKSAGAQLCTQGKPSSTLSFWLVVSICSVLYYITSPMKSFKYPLSLIIFFKFCFNKLQK
jgi:hypothetical protein